MDDSTAGHPRAQVVRLADVIELTHADLVQANPTTDNLSHPVTDVLLYDPLDDLTDVADRILLALGVSPVSPDFDDLLARAARGGAAAVAVKAHGAPVEDLRAAAVRHGIAVLVAPDSADWSRLATLARMAVTGAPTDSLSGARLGDLYAFANAVASMTGAAASLVDPLGRIVGYSTLPDQPIDELRRRTTLSLAEVVAPAYDPDFKKVYDSPRAIHVPLDEGGYDRLALAVRAGGELLGTVWLVDPGPAARAASLDALDRLAPLIGLHLLHARSAADFGERRNGDLIRTLLDDPVHAGFTAAQLGLDPRGGLAVAAFTIVRPEPGRLDLARETHRLLHLVTTVCDVYLNRSSTAVIDSTVYAVLTGSGEAVRSRHRRLLHEVQVSSPTISAFPVVGAVGGVVTSVAALPTSRDQALRTLGYLWHRARPAPGDPPGSGAMALYEDHRIPLNLVEVHDFIVDQGLGEGDVVAAIEAHDQRNDTDYLETLRAFAMTNGTVSEMAALLHVHKNTVRYRLGRLVDEFDLAIDDPLVRLWCALRLSIDDLTRGPSW